MSILDPNPICGPGDEGWPSTDFDTGRRLAWEFSRRIRWVQDANAWYTYQDGCWKKENLEQSKAAAATVCTEQLRDNQEGQRTATYIKNVLQQAKPWLSLTPDQFDNDPHLLCCADGVVDLSAERCGVFLEHSPDYLMTLSTGVELRPYVDKDGVVVLPEDWGFQASEWENHLNYMTQNLDAEQGVAFRDFFCRWSGTALLGSQNMKPHHFLNLTGQGRNGKGVAAEVRVAVLGDYGMIGPIRLVTRKQSDHSTELASCDGKRLLVVEEVSMVQSVVVKDLTGGGTMTARRMRQDDMTFNKSWALELNSNAPLNLQGESTKAIRRRKIVANLGDEIPVEAQRDGVINAILEEKGLILCWMVEGLRRWHEDGGRSKGLRIPKWMVDEAEMQSDDDDVIAAMIAENYEETGSDEDTVLGSVFVRDVNDRRKESGFMTMTPAAIYSYLRDAGHKVERGHSNKTYIHGLKKQEFNFANLAERANANTWN